MRKIFYILLSLSLFISCAGGNASEMMAPPATKGETYTLKITTLLYDTESGVKKGLPADDLVNISVGIGGKQFQTKLISELNKGIEIPKESDISISLEATGETLSVLWLGYDFEEEYVTSLDVDINMDRDITLTLIASETDEVLPAYMQLNVTGEGMGGSVKIGDNIYKEGGHQILFVTGLNVQLEAILPEDDEDGAIAFGGFETTKENYPNPLYSIAIDGDIVVLAKFIDTTASNTTITISGFKDSDGALLKINNTNVTLDSDGKCVLTEQVVGKTLNITLVPGIKNFMSWNDSLSGYISGELSFEYVIKEDAEIYPIFAIPTGVLTVSINPKTNYYTAGNMHRENVVEYIITSADGTVKKSSGLAGGQSSLAPLNQNNGLINVEAKDKVELIAIPGEGFFDGGKDPTGTNISWTGSGITSKKGTNFIVQFDDEAKSKAIVTTFTIEKRTVEVNIKKYQTSLPGVEEPSTNDVKGYTIKVNGISYKDTVKTTAISVPWHSKVDVEIIPGTHYQARGLYNGNDENAQINPLENYNNSVATYGVTTLSYAILHNVTNIAEIDHKNVSMTLNIAGGAFPTDTLESINNLYRGAVKITGTGFVANEKTHYAANFYDGTITTDHPYSTTFDVLSGKAVDITALTTSAALFVNHKIANGNTQITTNLKFQNTGNSFTVTTSFKSPRWKATVDVRRFIETASKTYTPETDAFKTEAICEYKISSVVSSFTERAEYVVTNGIPFDVSASDNDDYSVLKIFDKTGVQNNTITLMSNALINVDYLHKQIYVTLNIYGGRDDNNQSRVVVTGTGLPTYDNKTYYASNRNVSVDGKNEKNVAQTYSFKTLSGIKNKLTITAMTSSVHNFHKIWSHDKSIDFESGGGDGLQGGDKYKPGRDTYSSTNINRVSVTPQNDNMSVIDVHFRINSLAAELNGLEVADHDYATFKPDTSLDIDKKPTIAQKDGKNVHLVYYPEELLYLVKKNAEGKDFSGETIRLSRDIYIGESAYFNGFLNTFRGTFEGNGYTIFDVNLPKAMFSDIDNAYVKGLVLGRGHIGNGSSTDEVGLIGKINTSKVEYITNATRTTSGGKNVGGIIGYYESPSLLSYLVNYSDVYGSDNVGGIIGLHSDNIDQNNYYFANYGKVNGANYVGGVIGRGAGQYDNTKKHSYVFNKGNVNATGNYVGGIIGLADWGALEIHNFYNTGEISGANSGGIAGLIRGYRKVNDLGQKDTSKNTYPLYNGYNVGKVTGDGNAAIVSRSGYRADGGEHYIHINNVYSEKGLSDGDRYIYSGVPNIWGEDGGTFSDSFNNPKYTLFKTSRGDIWGDNPNGMHNILSITVSQLSTGVKDLSGLNDGNIWEQSIRPNINEYTSRPTLKKMPETDIPAYMYK